MSVPTSFHRDNALPKMAEKLLNQRSQQFLSQNRLTYAVGPMHLEHISHQIEPERDNIQHNRSPFADQCKPTLEQCDAVVGRLHLQSCAQEQTARVVRLTFARLLAFGGSHEPIILDDVADIYRRKPD